MPELPEVETTLRGIEPYVLNKTISAVIVRHPRLRWPIPSHLSKTLHKQKVLALSRRGKYLVFEFKIGALIIHLGMSGKLRILKQASTPQKHDHVDIQFSNNICLRFSDPRRFGAILWTPHPATAHPLLANLGIEPLTNEFNGNYLFTHAKQKKVPIKSFIMNSHIVTGVGNIYATEALFQARLHPTTSAGKISLASYNKLAAAIKSILNKAISQGGTTLKDFAQSDGKPGYFSIKLKVYGKQGQPCPRCNEPLTSMRITGRSTVYCASCQK